MRRQQYFDDEYDEYDYEQGDYEHDDDIDTDNEMPNNSNRYFNFIVFCNVIGLLTFGVWLFHRESRPEAVDFLLSPFDESLENQQNTVDYFVNSMKKRLGFKKIPLIKRFLRGTEGKRSSIKWQIVCNDISMAVKTKKELLEQRREDLRLLKIKRQELLKNTKIGALNNEIKGKIQNIQWKTLKSIKELENAAFDIHRILYNTAIVKSFAKDIKNRTELVESIKEYTRIKRGDNTYAQPANLFIQTSGVELNKAALSKIAGNEVTTAAIPVNFFNEFRFQEKEWEIKAPERRTYGETVSGYFDQLQSVEQELYELKFKNINYYDRFNEIVSQHQVYDKFLNEFLDVNNVANLKKRLRIHLDKQTERIKRLKKVRNPKVAQVIKADLYHKRNLTLLFTSKNVVYYERKYFRDIEYQSHFYEKLTGWFENTLELRKQFKNPKDYYDYMFRVLSDKSGTDVSAFNLSNGLSVMRYAGCICEERDIDNSWNNISQNYFNQNTFRRAIIQDGVVISMVKVGRLLCDMRQAKYDLLNVTEWTALNFVSNTNLPLLNGIKTEIMKKFK